MEQAKNNTDSEGVSNAKTNEMSQEIANLRLLLNSTAEGMYSIDCEGNCNFVNEAACRLLGYKEDGLIGKNMHNTIHYSYPDGTPYPVEQCQIYQAFRERINIYVDNEVVWRSDGTFCFVEYSSCPIFENGIIKGAIVCFSDISRRKEIEEIALLNQKLATTARRAGMADIATSILHNIGNILNSVKVSLSLLDENICNPQFKKLSTIAAMLKEQITNLPQFLSEDAKGKVIPEYLATLTAYLDNINTTSKHELNLLTGHIHHLEDIVLMQGSISGVSGKMEKILLSEVINTAIQMTGIELENTNIQICKELTESLSITTNKSILLQILINLILNAKDALLSSDCKNLLKTITVRVEKTTSKTVDIAVSDNGIGIEDSHLEKLFSFGFTTKPFGHGFGLNSCAIAVEELNGKLQAKSAGVGKDATFTLTLSGSE